MGELTLRRLLREVEVVAHRGDLDRPVSGVEHDSRRVRRGEVFFALDGARARGLDFVPHALERGAAAVVAGELVPAELTGEGRPAVAVEQVRRALALAACEAAGHPTRQVPTVGITGTNGKTTITFMLEQICRAAGLPAGVIGTINVRLGDRAKVSGFTTPEAPLLQALAGELVDEGAQILVMEVTSHGIAMYRSHGIGYRVVALTNLTQDHLDLHGTMEEYAGTKLRLFTDELAWSPEAVAVINIDDPFGQRVALEARCPVIRVSAEGRAEAEVRATRPRLSLDGTEATFELPGREQIDVRCPLIGAHNLSNISVAVGIAHALDLPHEAVIAGLRRVRVVPGRLERVPDPRGTAVLVDYAHTPDALAQVTEALAAFTKGRVIVVFGCGGDRDRSKRPRMGEAAARGGDLVLVTSDNPRTEDPRSIIEMALPGVVSSGLAEVGLDGLARAERGYAVEPDRRTAIRAAVTAAGPDDVVLIAGKGHEPYQILGDRRIHFDDREEVREAIRAVVATEERGRRTG